MMLTIQGQRLQQQLETLAELARGPEGICRLAYSESFWRSNEYVAGLMRQAGMEVSTNPVGNVVGTYAGEEAGRIVLGSHIDSEVNAGMFDGCLGVLAGIEAVRTLHENGIRPRHTIEVAAFAEEEGLVIAGLVGSRAYCGLPPTEIMVERMEQHGFNQADFVAARCKGPIDYALELHIEQGCVLENQRRQVGVVSAIIALKRFLVEFSGTENHAGTTPMPLRNDALVKAARFVQRVRQVVMETDPDMVGTVGKLDVTPNAMNTIPGKVVLTLELRALNAASIDIAYQRLMDEFRDDISACQLTMQQPSYHMDDTVRQAIREAAADLGFTWMDMGSGAGHDSMSLAQVTRAGMIFVPSIGGISHSPLEKTSWEDVANGANVLLRAAEKLDRL